MPKKSYKTAKLALLGLGLENQALLSWLDKSRAPVAVTICDRRPRAALPPHTTKNIAVDYRLGEQADQDLGAFDLLFRSPGWPLNSPGIRQALKLGQTRITSPLNLFLSLCPSQNIIGVTGTKGKGTTASLIYAILRAAGRKTGRQAFIGGNIGIAPFSFLSRIRPADYVILELSSFQLEDLSISPRLAVITNLFKEHLAPADPNNPNYHASLAAYWNAKLNIARGQENKYLIANQALEKRIARAASQLPGKVCYFTSSQLPSRLAGNYNQQNIAAAVTVADILRVKRSIYEEVIRKFKNLEHRLELVQEKNGVKFFDNSFSTTPESTILDLQSFAGEIIQIAGGADKGADFLPLARAIKKKTGHLILLPGLGSEKLLAALDKVKFPRLKLSRVTDMAQAVLRAKKLSKPGTTVLLSTGCASFGIFKNYKQRGDLFQRYVKQDA